MPVTTLLIDLDDTIYAASAGVWGAIEVRIESYMHERLHIPAADVPTIRHQLWQQYGTTLRGLQNQWHVDEVDFVAYVHDVPIDRLLSPDPLLREALQSCPQRKFIFTNADRNHATRVLNRLEVADCFEGIVDILDVSPYCKPMSEAFTVVLQRAGVQDPRECLFADDSLLNLAAARELGFYTVRVGSREAHPACHASIERLAELPAILAELVART